MNLKFSKIRDVKSPLYSTIGSAGIDIFMPNDSKKIKIEPGQTALIPSGLKFNIPPNYVLVAFNRSSIASKKMLIVGACVIDSDYQGEVFVNLSNIGNYYQELNPGDKLIQLILLPAPQINLEEKEISHLYDTTTERGEGGFGSTDKDEFEIFSKDLLNSDNLIEEDKKEDKKKDNIILDLSDILPFGKYKGDTVSKVITWPDNQQKKRVDYLYWLFEKTHLKPSEEVKNLLRITQATFNKKEEIANKIPFNWSSSYSKSSYINENYENYEDDFIEDPYPTDEDIWIGIGDPAWQDEEFIPPWQPLGRGLDF